MRQHTETAIIVGGTGSVGRAIVERWRTRGGQAVVWDRDATVDTIACDVTDAGSVEHAMTETLKRVAPPSVFVNCAAIGGTRLIPASEARTVEEWNDVLAPADHWSRLFSVNVIGAANCLRSFARTCSERAQGGAVVNVSSVSGSAVAEAGTAAYSASKAALDMLTKVAAVELGPLGITVNAISPGFMETRMKPSIGGSYVSDRVDAASFTPVGRRLGTAADIAEAVLALLSASWVTGQVVLADGGVTLAGPRRLVGR